MVVRQIPRKERWPSGDSRDLAELRHSPEDLASQFGFTFEQLHDDLDWLQLAAIELPDGSHAWLYRYRGDQDNGTFVRVDAHADLAHAKAQLAHLLHLNESRRPLVSTQHLAMEGTVQAN
jgi:hypothetical protein